MNKTDSYYFSGSFPQWARTFFTAKNGLPSNEVLCAAMDKKGRFWAGTAKGLVYFENEGFVTMPVDAKSPNMAVTLLFCDDTGILWVGCGDKLYTCKNNKISFVKAFGENCDIVGMAQHGPTVFLLTKEVLYRLVNGDWQVAKPVDGTGLKLTVFEEMPFVLTEERVIMGLSCKRPRWKSVCAKTSDMPNCAVNDIKFDSWGHLWVGTDEGVYIYDNTDYWIGPNEIDNLPAEKINAIEFSAAGVIYFASDNGVICLEKGALKYLGAMRWVPATDVTAVAVSDDGNTVWAATDAGLSRITTGMMTLLQKAEHYQKTTEAHHVRDGFVCGRGGLVDEDLNTGSVHISDNDGLWTGCYAAAETFRYAVTGKIDALANARRSIKAMIYLTKVSGIPGFTARAVRRPGEEGFGNGDGEWDLTTDGSCEWKCETSSDEMVGHFLAFSLYYDICASDGEKKEIEEAVCGMVDHMIRNDYKLIDKDGLPTTWANWAPASLNHDNKWVEEKGVNSLELLSFLKTAYHMSGNEVYNNEYKDLIKKHHYILNVAQHKIQDGHGCHIDDNLGFLSTLTLLRLEQDPTLRTIVFMGLEHHWQYEKIERTPLWNFIYSAFTGRYCDIDAGIQTLRETPLSLIEYKITNSTRKKLAYNTEIAEPGEPAQLAAPLPADERRVGRDDSNHFRVDSGNGTSAEDGSFFLLPYWFARYSNLIKGPE